MMKISQILLLSMLASGSALAEDNSEESVYASQLCHIVSSEKSVSTADQYVEKISHDLGQKIAKKDQFAAMEDANQLTRAAMDLGEPVPAKLTKELTLLDFYGREIEIGALSKDKNKISAATRDIKQVWKSLKPAIEAKSPNTEEPAKFEHVVKQLEEAKDFGTYKDLSTSFLTQVDSLESASGGAGSQAQNP